MTKFCPICGAGWGAEFNFCPNDGTDVRSVGTEDDPLLGYLLDGRYRLTDELGQGGMGVVFRAVDIEESHPVAIKLLSAHNQPSESAFARFRREAKILSQFTQPNLVALFEYGRDEDAQLVYFAMEYVGGVTLTELRSGGRILLPLALEIIDQAAQGLAHAHSHGVVHRDLKPSNLMLTARENDRLHIEVLDFGVARPIDAHHELTKTGIVPGTPHYMAPEQIEDVNLDHRVDLYALGVILFEMLTGERPIDGDSQVDILLGHLEKRPPILSERMPPDESVPVDVDALVDTLLSKDPERRYENAEALRAEIEAIRSRHAIPAIPDCRSAGLDSVIEAAGRDLPSIEYDESTGKVRSPKSISEVATDYLPAAPEPMVEDASELSSGQAPTVILTHLQEKLKDDG